MESGLKHFLIVFDAGLGRQIRITEFENADDAVEAYRAEEDEYRGRADVQVVLVASDSLETVKHTHANLFSRAESSDDQMRALAEHVLSSTMSGVR